MARTSGSQEAAASPHLLGVLARLRRSRRRRRVRGAVVEVERSVR